VTIEAIDVRDLIGHPGASREVGVRGVIEGLAGELAEVPDEIEGDLLLESVVEGILVSGSVRATATGACVRCLEPATYPVDAPFQELFAYADRAAHHHEVGADANGADEDVVRVLEGDLIDLEPVIRDAVVPSLPFQPVCRDDCPGLCSECGALLAEDPDHHHDTIDPRWAALSGVFTETQNPEKRT